MRNIIITGGELFNKGAQAMTFIAVHELAERFPDHKVYLLSEMDLARPKSEREQYAFEFLGWHPIKFAKSQKNFLLRSLCKVRNGNALAEAEKVYRNCDLMIDISGYALGSNWSKRNNERYLNHLEFAKAFGIPVYLMPQSFGPFDFGEAHPGIHERCRELLPTCRVILAREQEGYGALVDTYGLTNVQLAPDLVLNNKGIDLSHVFKKVPVYELPEIRHGSIAVIPNGRNLSVGDETAVMELYVAAIRKGLEQGKNVYLLHHATSDAEICVKLKAAFAEEAEVILLEREFNCLEFNELVQKFDYLVASRFHAIVHAYKNGIPCVVLGWAKKYEELLAQFEQSIYLFDIRNLVDKSDIIRVMDQMNERKNRESQTIRCHLELMQQYNVFDVLRI